MAGEDVLFASLEARAARLRERNDPEAQAMARAVSGVLIPIVRWLMTERDIRSHVGLASASLCDCIGRSLVIVSDFGSPDGQSPMVGVEAMLDACREAAELHMAQHAEKLRERNR